MVRLLDSSRSYCAVLLCLVLSNIASGYCSPLLLASPFGMNHLTRIGLRAKPPYGSRQLGASPALSGSVARHQRLAVRGGGTAVPVAGKKHGEEGDLSKCPFHNACWFLSSLWGAGGVVMILVKSIKRILPIALEPFTATSAVAEAVVSPLTNFQMGAYVLTCIWFAYVEGYKGFQTKFAPLVVARSLTINPFTSPFHHVLFGPLYAMGLFHATKKRKVVSWSVTIGVAFIVAAVKRMSYPWRNMIDAGVVVGLTWGGLSIALGYIAAVVRGKPPEGVDPALPSTAAVKQ